MIKVDDLTKGGQLVVSKVVMTKVIKLYMLVVMCVNDSASVYR